MSTFVIRPEINNASAGDYERLHDAMYTRRIYKVIKLDDGSWRDLPTGTYRAELDDVKPQDVFNIAIAALNSIGKYNTDYRRDYELIVFMASGSYSDLPFNTDKSKRPPGS
ncbi:hypothetical protein [Pedobacter antarcticus]|uniref:hypothetical protein n=1 Tax=Pedobacter antarcticus TaxID=34086 RepID=UPI00292F4CBA|nr:hypothetical protein [Pedobacter antarcticus]